MSCDMSKDNDRCQSLTFPLADGTFCDTDKVSLAFYFNNKSECNTIFVGKIQSGV